MARRDVGPGDPHALCRRESTDGGPDFCAPCSELTQEWVAWDRHPGGLLATARHVVAALRDELDRVKRGEAREVDLRGRGQVVQLTPADVFASPRPQVQAHVATGDAIGAWALMAFAGWPRAGDTITLPDGRYRTVSRLKWPAAGGWPIIHTFPADDSPIDEGERTTLRALQYVAVDIDLACGELRDGMTLDPARVAEWGDTLRRALP